MQEPLLQTKQAAEIIGKSEHWLWLKRKSGGDGPSWYKIGGRFMYLKSELEAWIRAQRHE